jgi:hypothetical protein
MVATLGKESISTFPHLCTMSDTSPKVFIKTFGCQMNEYDSDKMVDVLNSTQGYEQTQNMDEADLIVFNTCSVREKAQEKVFSDLGPRTPPQSQRRQNCSGWMCCFPRGLLHH